MEHLVKKLIENLVNKRIHEFINIEKYKKDNLKDMILISSGKIFELDAIIHELNELLAYNLHTKSKNK